MRRRVKPEDVVRVEEFRNRLVAFANYVNEHRPKDYLDDGPSKRVQQKIGHDQTSLSQAYGSIQGIIAPFGTAMMHQYGMIVSQDVVRDAIQTPAHPGYGDVASMAIGHIDMIIGRLRAEVEDGRGGLVSAEALYRYTSIAFWVGRLGALIRWLVLTGWGRITAVLSVLVIAIVSGIVSGAAQAWFEQLLRSSPSP